MPQTKHLLLIFVPALIIVGTALFVRVIQYKPLYPTQEQLTEYNDNSLHIPILAGDPILGNKKAPITIIAFEDFACPACKTQSDILKQLLEKHPNDVKLIWKGLPVTTFPHNSRESHLASFCAHEQGLFEPFKDFAFANSDNLSSSIVQAIIEQLPNVDSQGMTTCLTSDRPETYILQTEQIATDIGIQTVPTIFVNNKQVTPPTTLGGWEVSLGLVE
ncbi:MAG: hypothetical protein COU33_00945 [Candidatus Magasanikbacteria bacterium CG10_big_fil_rev_8_21_14_0_10_43_6]|uniref:Thioredoxin-like fold domain-containing protein n=1 Tax=Candidatus Magasanikbacteria bacterium CG10_big_fil_rev_8_21_14_0_10_43_6 TaxID=1974650 RepID=A0A2M6W209_9BACT|nr:MAG: hypothetical protein COU33_00945 [Candidatus Magasanikbacteria bacterium CG10_big_fil_rev_8_21_14_0_10_43_6]